MKKITFYKLMILLLFLFASNYSLYAQFSINDASTNYTQNFNSLNVAGGWVNNSTLTGWYARTNATASITSFGLNTGATTTAGLYSFGSTSNPDRALGFMASNTYTGSAGVGKGYIGWRLLNNTGSNIVSITVTWTGEQWRKENNASVHTLDLFYQVASTVTDLISGTWISANSSFTSPIVGATTAIALDGNLSANRVANIVTTINVTIPNGSEIMLRWEDLNDAGSDHAMAIDDVTVNATIESGTPLVATPTFNPVAGTYYSDQNVTISTETVGATIRYTTNGNDPDETSTIFTTPIVVSATTTIKAKAFKTDMNPSDVASATYTIVKTPTITVEESSIPAMSAYVDASDSKIITVNGVNLSENITLALGGNNPSQFRLSTSTLTQTDGSVTDASVTIYYEPKATGSHTATVTLSSTGAENVVKTLSGEATWTPLTTPVAEAASGTNNNGFTANWVEVAGATEYQLNVYTKETATETFDTAPTAPTGWTFSGVGSYTASSTGYFGTTAPSVKFDGSADNIVSTTYVNSPNRVSFWLRGASTDANSALLFEGYNGTEWTTIENIQPVPTVATTKVYDGNSSPSLSGNFNQYRFTYTKSAGNLAFDDFSAIRVDNIVGSPFTIVGETTKVLSGLNSGTTYYYTVIAKNSNVTSDVSNEITAPTMSTSNNDLLYGLNIRVTNANIHFAATAGEKVEVYNAVGQKIISTLATDGQNELPVNAKGVMIVKVGSRLAKVIL